MNSATLRVTRFNEEDVIATSGYANWNSFVTALSLNDTNSGKSAAVNSVNLASIKTSSGLVWVYTNDVLYAANGKISTAEEDVQIGFLNKSSYYHVGYKNGEENSGPYYWFECVDEAHHQSQ